MEYSRIAGAVFGSLVGDALGVPVEFSSRRARKIDPVVAMRAYGVWNQPAGTWSDDGALLLCSVDSLVQCQGYDAEDMGRRFVRWREQGLWTAHGHVFDIGNATANALARIADGCPAEQAGGRGEGDNGNGSLMRILPVSLAVPSRAEDASGLTHGHERSLLACRLHAYFVKNLLHGALPSEAWETAREAFFSSELGAERRLFEQFFPQNLHNLAEDAIGSGGYVLDTLRAAIWCLLTTNDYATCTLKAVNLGGDTDTTGCVAGGLAGLVYGQQNIPEAWIAALPHQADLQELCSGFAQLLGAK